MTERERELTELVERRTGAPLPVMSDAFADARAALRLLARERAGQGPDRAAGPVRGAVPLPSHVPLAAGDCARARLPLDPWKPTVQTHEITRRFTDHFTKAGHTGVPSASLILDDPNLLFVNAGMVQFKPYFLGEVPPPYPRATSIQKCVRTGDIDEVGKTTRHNTFFQMAGNFSFGDYFKAGAIELAWKLVTGSQDAGGYGFDPDRIWATVYHDDDEAFELWRKIAGLPAERIQRRGGEDNYWDMGVPGPGRALLGDLLRPRARSTAARAARSSTRTATWRSGTSSSCRTSAASSAPKNGHPPIGSLPKKNIDTGMGIERVAFLLQGVPERLRDRPGPPGDRPRRGALRPPLRRRPRPTTCGSG